MPSGQSFSSGCFGARGTASRRLWARGSSSPGSKSGSGAAGSRPGACERRRPGRAWAGRCRAADAPALRAPAPHLAGSARQPRPRPTGQAKAITVLAIPPGGITSPSALEPVGALCLPAPAGLPNLGMPCPPAPVGSVAGMRPWRGPGANPGPLAGGSAPARHVADWPGIRRPPAARKGDGRGATPRGRVTAPPVAAGGYSRRETARAACGARAASGALRATRAMPAGDAFSRRTGAPAAPPAIAPLLAQAIHLVNTFCGISINPGGTAAP